MGGMPRSFYSIALLPLLHPHGSLFNAAEDMRDMCGDGAARPAQLGGDVDLCGLLYNIPCGESVSLSCNAAS